MERPHALSHSRRTSLSTLAIAAAVAAVGAQPSSKLIWQQAEAAAVYTSAGLSRHAGTTPTFSTATWLNQPIYVEVYNVSDSGENVWSYSDTNNQATFMTVMARHAEEGSGPGAVDLVAAESNFVAPSNCVVRGWNSLGNGVPVWTWNMSSCASSLLYDSDTYVGISDDGSTAAFCGFVASGATTIATLWVFDAQTGAVKYTKPMPGQGHGGPVQVSANGTWIAWTSGDSVIVLDGTTGAVRDTIAMDWNTMAALSDSGAYLAFAGEDSASIYTWSAATNAYTLTYSPVPAGGQWFSISCAISSDGSGTAEAELVTFAWITETALGARVTMYSMVTGALLTDYSTPVNAALQTNPTAVMDGNYAGVCLWGDKDDVPTAVVLTAGSNTPVFSYVTPGSMFGCALVRDSALSTPTTDYLWFATAGKATPANVMGNGGDAYAWQITVPV